MKDNNIEVQIKTIIQNLEDRKENVERFKENLYKLFEIITDLIQDKMTGANHDVDAVLSWWDGSNWRTNMVDDTAVYMRIYRGKLGLWRVPYLDYSEFNEVAADEIDYINIDNAKQALTKILNELENINTHKDNADAIENIVKQFEETMRSHYGKALDE